MRKRKEAMATKIAEELQVPRNAICNTFSIEFRGQNSVSVEGCLGVLEYDENTLTLNLGNNTVRFTGHNLEISNFFEQQALLTGTVIFMEFIG